MSHSVPGEPGVCLLDGTRRRRPIFDTLTAWGTWSGGKRTYYGTT